jgi:hypothetical protein
MSGTPHRRAGGGSRAKGRKSKPGFRQGKPDKRYPLGNVRMAT